jgi:two-component system sensor histidine kinase UhpB
MLTKHSKFNNTGSDPTGAGEGSNKRLREAGSAMSQTSTLDEVAVRGGIITDDRPVDFHALGLAGCIDRLTVPLRQGGTSVRWETPHHGIEIPAACAALLYHAAQEFLSNAFKYAHATQVTVRLAAVYHGIRLDILDNGVGFDSQSLSGRLHAFGLRLMTIAVHEAGGTIAIDSGFGKGTRVTITLPLD